MSLNDWVSDQLYNLVGKFDQGGRPSDLRVLQVCTAASALLTADADSEAEATN